MLQRAGGGGEGEETYDLKDNKFRSKSQSFNASNVSFVG